ncbi:MAG: hypothetical protein J7L47_07365 [Candidatus Odinarchaeota archaeon]|nr:hypothetical protein [Candidatus Odinarchaeota archaeon]
MRSSEKEDKEENTNNEKEEESKGFYEKTVTTVDEINKFLLTEVEQKNKMDPQLIHLLSSKDLDITVYIPVSFKVTRIDDDVIKLIEENNGVIRRVIKIISKIAVNIKPLDLIKILKDERIVSANYDRMIQPLKEG